MLIRLLTLCLQTGIIRAPKYVKQLYALSLCRGLFDNADPVY